MIEAARFLPMDATLRRPRADFPEDSSGSGAEGRNRKRFQRTASENEDPARRSGMSLPFGRGNGPSSNDPKPISHARRRSTLRESSKPPLLGPRPFENKRVISDSHYQSSLGGLRPSQPPSTPTSFHPPQAYNQDLPGRDSRTGDIAQQQQQPRTTLTMDQLGSSDSSTEFLPSVGFDELHASLTAYDSDVNNFPPPGSRDGLNTISISTPADTNMRIPNNTGIAKEREQTGKISRSQSLVRRFSNAPGKGSQSSVTLDTSTMPPPSAPAAGKGRRQSTLSSTLPQAGATQASRPPRKSVGPGFLSQTTASRAASRESRVTPSHSTPSLIRTASITRPNRLAPGAAGATSTNEPTGPAARNLRTKSLQPPPRGQTHPLLSAATPVNDPSIGTAVSPRAQRQGSQTPSSASNGNRRLSTVYVGGLGARTISPTDARRNRRMSALPKNLALPQPAFASQPELTSMARASTQSPALPVRKSVTPSSARNTPDFSRRPVNSSLQSMSSSSSFGSLRMSTASGPRNSQILSASRLPTPKPRNVHSSAGIADEEVPPVPAIPKAYESPKDQHHTEPSYFVPRRPVGSDIEDPGGSTPVSQMSKLNPKPSVTVAPAPMTDAQKRDSRQATNPRHRRGLTVGAGTEPERHVIAQPNLNKKNLQPLRLPPLNLLPLSTPTSARIASLPAPMGDVDARHQTPPPARTFVKTPSTPMTASKATFFSRSRPDEDGFHMFNNFRSNSSHHLMRSESVDVQNQQMGLSAGMAIPMGAPRSTASPFSSNSLPRTGDCGPMSTPQAGTPVDSFNYSHPFIPGLEADGLGTPLPSPKMAQPTLQGPNPSARTSSSDEPGTPASTTSLRRKLSMTWKRSSSKASQRAQAAAAAAQAEKDEQNRKQNEMPPPKMPASATWTSRNSSDTGSSRPSLDIRVRMTSNGVAQNQSEAGGIPHFGSSTQHRSQTEVGNPKPETIQPPPPYADHRRVTSRSSSSSILSPVQRMLGSKSSLSTLRGRNLDTNLDKDDLAADKIMEKLASKRKDFESAAKEVDELRRRAYPKERVSPSQAIQMVNLNIFERGEIIDYKEVYFCGTRNAKKHIGDLDVQTNNFGYDDERGDYNIIMGDHLAYRYEVVDMLGKGSFGQVVRCIDHKTGGLVAIKIIRNKKRFHQQALVEVNILQKLREWDPENKHSMINFTQSFYFRGHLCISTELLGINLYEFIKAYEFKGFPLPLIRRFSKQMLSSLALLKSKRVIHCDLKPENILLAHPMHSEIKVIDFGSSCFENEKVYTYIQSRFYRSPEVILGMSYGIPIDMWSLGCILAELYTGYPIFPGENEQEQLACIMEIFGPPEKHLIEKSSRKKLFFDSMGKPRVTVSSKGRRRRPSSKTLQSALKCDDEAFLDFLTACLRWDPERRLRPEQALQHEYITGIKRVLAPGGRPGRMGTTIAGAHNSPIKRFNPAPQTPQRLAGTRDASGTIRPLPEPPGTSFRTGPASAASPVKTNGLQPGRRHSTLTAIQQPPPAGPGKRVHTTTGTAGTSAGLAAAIASGRAAGARAASGRADMASAAAAVSLQRTR